MNTLDQQLHGVGELPKSGLIYLPAPRRLLDTRVAATGACILPGAALIAPSDNLYQAKGSCSGIPATARGIFGNATFVNFAANGFVTMFPDSSNLTINYALNPPITNRPFIATVNLRTAIAVQNQPFSIGLGKNGKFWIYTVVQTDVIIDLVGYIL